MRKKFDTFEYVEDLGKELIWEFEKVGKTTHPHSVGEGKEKSAINKLKSILPSGIGVGSGFVIDSYGNVSSQCDIIIYEKDLCLKFNAEDEKNCYYNCESVIAVGEVKTKLDRNSFIDSIKKFKKIKNLKRKIENNRNFRSYLSRLTAYGAEIESYNQQKNYLDQIFAFILADSISIAYENMVQILEENNKLYEYPNTIVSVDGKCLGYCKQRFGTLLNIISPIDADSFAYGDVVSPFGMLLDRLFFIIEHGRTTKYNPGIYITKSQSYTVKRIPINNIKVDRKIN